jgi:hypothetical protein
VSETGRQTYIHTDRQIGGGGESFSTWITRESFSTWITYVTFFLTYFFFRGGERVQFVDYLRAGSGDACVHFGTSQVL